jgi:hypothetical protein
MGHYPAQQGLLPQLLLAMSNWKPFDVQNGPQRAATLAVVQASCAQPLAPAPFVHVQTKLCRAWTHWPEPLHIVSPVHAVQVLPAGPQAVFSFPGRQEPMAPQHPVGQGLATEQATQLVPLTQIGVVPVHAPQLRSPPQPSEIVPQILPWAAHVVFVHPQTPGVPGLPPPQVWGPVQTVPHDPQLPGSVLVSMHAPPQNV